MIVGLLVISLLTKLKMADMIKVSQISMRACASKISDPSALF